MNKRTIASSVSCHFFIFIFCLLLFHDFSSLAGGSNGDKTVNIGAIINANSRIGREVKTAIDITSQNYNTLIRSNDNYKLVLHVRYSESDPLQAASAADELIKKQRVQAILGMETWQETALVAEVGNRAQVPVLSLARSSAAASLTSVQWPFLVRMANDESTQMRCVADIVQAYQWKRVIAVYEDDTYGSDSGFVNLLSDALREVGSQVEYRLGLPPLSSVSNPKDTIRRGLEKLKNKQNRVFVLVQSSLQFAAHLFAEAKEMGLMEKESVWIITDSVTSVLDSVNSSVISSMQGVLGIKTFFSNISPSFRDFYIKFRKKFRSEYPEEDNFETGIYALQAHDAISILTQAIEKSGSRNSSSRELLENILSSDFSGLSGKIRFRDGELSQPPTFQIINVFGKSYKELDLWSPDLGFWENFGGKIGGGGGGATARALSGPINWPGGLLRAPLGWEFLADRKLMKIGVPGKTSFQKFVKVVEESENKKSFSGFCIEIFEAAFPNGTNNYSLLYEFVPFNGSYDELVDQVYYKNFDAVVGDVTILANRTDYVEFSLPYAESGLSMVVPVRKISHKAWMFLKPFTMTMWLATVGILIYTMFVVWFLEHRTNRDFRGPWKSQLGTALWFTFSTLFFAHRERLNSNFTRVVMVVWLFVVLVLNSSYTANLASVLTVQRLEPTATDIETLKRDNAIVGCDGDSFIRKYLVDVLGFKPKNIKNVTSEYSFPGEFDSGNIGAAFLELPYEKSFLSQHCKN